MEIGIIVLIDVWIKLGIDLDSKGGPFVSSVSSKVTNGWYALKAESRIGVDIVDNTVDKGLHTQRKYNENNSMDIGSIKNSKNSFPFRCAYKGKSTIQNLTVI